MGSSRMHQWETDPLFPAAEVVQDSADRMQSLYLLILHEKSLIEDDQPDPRLLSSIKHHRRDLSTILETAKWQLEDFERAAKVPPALTKSRRNEDAITRHWQFITAIKEHINRIERALPEFSNDDPTATSKWAVDETEGDLLASFLTGETPTDLPNQYEPDKGHLLRRFLDPIPSSRLKDNEIVESIGNMEKHDGQMNGVIHDHNLNDRKCSSSRSESLSSPLPFLASKGHTSGKKEYCPWDLEANETTPSKCTSESKWRSHQTRMNFLGFLARFWRNKNRKYAKRWKDGEENWHTDDDDSRAASLPHLYPRFGHNASNLTGQVGATVRRVSSHGPRLRLQLILTSILVLLALYTVARTIV